MGNMTNKEVIGVHDKKNVLTRKAITYRQDSEHRQSRKKVKIRQQSKKLQIQGAKILRNETYL